LITQADIKSKSFISVL